MIMAPRLFFFLAPLDNTDNSIYISAGNKKQAYSDIWLTDLTVPVKDIIFLSYLFPLKSGGLHTVPRGLLSQTSLISHRVAAPFSYTLQLNSRNSRLCLWNYSTIIPLACQILYGIFCKDFGEVPKEDRALWWKRELSRNMIVWSLPSEVAIFSKGTDLCTL